MRNASTGLKSFLAGSPTEIVTCDLVTLVLADGTIVRMANASLPQTVTSQYDNASHTFPVRPVFTRGQTTLKVGLELDTLDLTITPDPLTDTLESMPWPKAARLGLLDNATVVVEKLLMPAWGSTTNGTLILFWGRVGEVAPSRSTVKLTVQSLIDELRTTQLPRNIYQPTCVHTVYDKGCTLLKASFQATGAAASGSTASVINSGLTQADHYFDLGYLTFTSGVNNGVTRFVQSFLHTSGQISVAPPFGAAPGIGDTFTIVPGCNKLYAGDCASKFSNTAHYRGYDFIPDPVVAR